MAPTRKVLLATFPGGSSNREVVLRGWPGGFHFTNSPTVGGVVTYRSARRSWIRVERGMVRNSGCAAARHALSPGRAVISGRGRGISDPRGGRRPPDEQLGGVRCSPVRIFRSSSSDCRRNDRWYEKYVPMADALYDEHLVELRREGLIDGT